MGQLDPLVCGVCNQLFTNRQNKVKHERFSKSCGERIPAQRLRLSVSETVKVINVTEEVTELAIEPKTASPGN